MSTDSVSSRQLPPLDESLLALLEEEERDAAGAVLYRLSVDVECACLLSSMSRQQRRAVEDIEQKHRTNILLPLKAPHSHTIGAHNNKRITTADESNTAPTSASTRAVWV